MYVWSEPSMVGAMSNAADRLGWPTLQEFRITKKNSKNGRADLYVQPSRTKIDWCMEVKYVPFRRGNPNKTHKIVQPKFEQKWNEARAQVRSIDRGTIGCRLIALIAVPHDNEPIDNTPKGRRLWLEKQIETVRDNLPSGAIVEFCGGYLAEPKTASVRGEDGRYHPGFVLVVTRAKLRPRSQNRRKRTA